VDASPPEKLRADAERNRAALVAAARTAFRERGLDVPLDDIARRAGVGNATLYRRFPSRRDLISAVFLDRLADYARAVEQALDAGDPWSGFREYVHHVCGLQAEDRGLADLLVVRADDEDEDFERLRIRAYDGFVELVRRAQEQGSLRADYQPEDLVVLLMANAGLVDRTADDAPTGWERFVSFVLDGLHQPAATPAPPSPGSDAVLAAMRTQWAVRVSGEGR
jgi:AcrR family transcriptional regulator